MRKIIVCFFLSFFILTGWQSINAKEVLVIDSTEDNPEILSGKVETISGLLFGHFVDSESLDVPCPINQLPSLNELNMLYKGKWYVFAKTGAFAVFNMRNKDPEEVEKNIRKYPMYHAWDILEKRDGSSLSTVSNGLGKYSQYRVESGRILIEYWPRFARDSHVSMVLESLKLYPVGEPELKLEKQYAHSDYQTTCMLNFFSGKEKLPPSLAAEMQVKLFTSWINAHVMSASFPVRDADIIRLLTAFQLSFKLESKVKLSPADQIAYVESEEFLNDAIQFYFAYKFDYSSHTEAFDTADAVINHSVSMGFVSKEEIEGLSKTDVKRKVVRRLTNFDALESDIPRDFIVEKYNKIWQMNQAHGAPKIAFTSNFSRAMGFGARSYYIPSQNTIYIGLWHDCDIEGYIQKWLSELSHADQLLRYSPVVISQRLSRESTFLDSLVQADKTGKFQGLEMWEINDKVMYSLCEPIGSYKSVENEAHFIFEPLLTEEYNEKGFWK